MQSRGSTAGYGDLATTLELPACNTECRPRICMKHPPILHLPTDRHRCTDCHRKHHVVNPNPSRRKTSTYSIAEALQGCRRYPARDRISQSPTKEDHPRRHRPSRRARRSVPRGGRALLRVVPSARHLHPVTILGDPANRLPVPNTTGTAANLRSIAVEPYRRPPCIWLVVERVSANCRRSLRQRRTFRSERT